MIAGGKESRFVTKWLKYLNGAFMVMFALKSRQESRGEQVAPKIRSPFFSLINFAAPDGNQRKEDAKKPEQGFWTEERSKLALWGGVMIGTPLAISAADVFAGALAPFLLLTAFSALTLTTMGYITVSAWAEAKRKKSST